MKITLSVITDAVGLWLNVHELVFDMYFILITKFC